MDLAKNRLPRCRQKSAERIEQPMKDEDVANAADRSPSLNQKSAAHRNVHSGWKPLDRWFRRPYALTQGNAAGDRQHVVAVVEQGLVEKR